MSRPAREQWLYDAAELVKPILKKRTGLEVGAIRIGVGDLGKSHQGVTFPRMYAPDGTVEITVSMREHVEQTPSKKILGILIHEMIHAAGIMNHRRGFAKAGQQMELTGSRPTYYGLDAEHVPEYAKAILEKIGEYPAPLMRVPKRGQKKQTTRMLKFQCEKCGFLMRTTAKWKPFANMCPSLECDGKLAGEETDETE